MKRSLTFLLSLAAVCVLFFSTPLNADAATMTSSDAFVEILKQREGFEKYPYKDNSQWSIGYGTRVPDGKLEYYQENGITEAEAEILMRDMLADFEAAVLKFAEKYKFTLTQNQFDALVSFSYNCGDAWTRETTGNMNRAVREGWTGSDFVYAICLWSKSAGKFSLINRRLYEANMYINGIYESPYNHETGKFRYVFLDAGQVDTEYVIHGYDIRDPKPIRYKFKSIPTGTDANGNAFTYEFAGWYTSPRNGKRIEVLDSSLKSASFVFAMWKDPAGKLVYLPKGESSNVTISVTKVNSYASVRTGPGTQHTKIGEAKKNTSMTLISIYDDGSDLWGQYEGGWICLKYTNYDEVAAEKEQWPRTGVVNGKNVNVRNGPGLSYTKKYQLNEGHKVTIHEKVYADDMYWGRLDDGNWISLTYVTLDEVAPEPEPEPEPNPAADIDGNGKIDEDDAIYLLQHILMPDVFPLEQSMDCDGNGVMNENDALYLLMHVFIPGEFPLPL